MRLKIASLNTNFCVWIENLKFEFKLCFKSQNLEFKSKGFTLLSNFWVGIYLNLKFSIKTQTFVLNSKLPVKLDAMCSEFRHEISSTKPKFCVQTQNFKSEHKFFGLKWRSQVQISNCEFEHKLLSSKFWVRTYSKSEFCFWIENFVFQNFVFRIWTLDFQQTQSFMFKLRILSLYWSELKVLYKTRGYEILSLYLFKHKPEVLGRKFWYSNFRVWTQHVFALKISSLDPNFAFKHKISSFWQGFNNHREKLRK